MFTTEKKRKLVNRLRFVQGQIGGIINMLEQEKPFGDVFIQIKASQAGLEKAGQVILEEKLKHDLIEQIAAALNDCPGECDYCEELERIRKTLGTIDFEKILKLTAQLFGDGVPANDKL